MAIQLEPPIRQGQKSYGFLVLDFTQLREKDGQLNQIDLPINLDDAKLQKYKLENK